MGIDNNSLRFLAEARSSGVDFSRSATIGRQNLYRLCPQLIATTLTHSGIAMSAAQAEQVCSSHGVYADGLLAFLGAAQLHSIDYSNYEKATHIFDMNRPSPKELDGAYTLVVDGGSLEHIFNFPQAIANCMNMVAVGGHFIGLSPANNFFGHGFYQFSAELLFRIFDRDNGFVAERVILVEDEQTGSGWFEVKDPAVAHERVTVMSATPAHIFVQARKIEQRAPFATMPYQSDYVATWTASTPASSQPASTGPLANHLRNSVKQLFPSGLKEWLRAKLFPGPRARPDLFKHLK
jgi:hypothetical protein